MTKRNLKKPSEVEKLRKDNRRLRKEFKDLQWGLLKTNESIKILYKELEKKNEELKKLDQLKSDFVSVVSHELRTPLTIIREGLSQVVDGVLGETSEKQAKTLSKALENTDRLSRIIDDLLDISKLEARKVTLNKTSVDIVELVKDVYAAFLNQASAKGLDLKVHCLSKNIFIEIDRDKIIQVFTNLISNALKFTPTSAPPFEKETIKGGAESEFSDGVRHSDSSESSDRPPKERRNQKGSIEIFIKDSAASVECSIKDTGRGISQDDLPKVFSKFEQFGRTVGPGQKGTGLGLSICKEIIALHGGEIWVESKLDQGTKFTFTLLKNSEQKS